MISLACPTEKMSVTKVKSVYDEAMNYSCDISIVVNGNEVDAKKLTDLLNVEQWDKEAVIKTNGIDENMASINVNKLLSC